MTTQTFILPAYWASALINNDESGMDNSEIEELNKFILDNKETNCRFNCIGCNDEEQYFAWSNDANNLGGDVLEYIFDITSITGVVATN